MRDQAVIVAAAKLEQDSSERTVGLEPMCRFALGGARVKRMPARIGKQKTLSSNETANCSRHKT